MALIFFNSFSKCLKTISSPLIGGIDIKIKSKINVTMIHGQKDEVVPVSYSRKVLKIFENAKKKLVIVKKGDHSLSSSKWLKLIKKELKLIIS